MTNVSQKCVPGAWTSDRERRITHPLSKAKLLLLLWLLLHQWPVMAVVTQSNNNWHCLKQSGISSDLLEYRWLMWSQVHQCQLTPDPTQHQHLRQLLTWYHNDHTFYTLTSRSIHTGHTIISLDHKQACWQTDKMQCLTDWLIDWVRLNVPPNTL